MVPDGGVAARSDDLAGIVDGAGLASASRRKDPQVRHGPVVPEKCVFGASPDDLSDVVDSKRDRVGRPAQTSEVRHRAVLPEEGAKPLARTTAARPDHLSCIVDRVRDAVIVARKGAQVGHRPVFPQHGPGPASSDGLSQVVDPIGPSSAEVRHGVVLP